MARQLVFDLSRAPCFAADDFLVSSANEAAVAVVQSWPDWPSRLLLLVGPPGSGKSHLAAIWAAQTQAVVMEADVTPPSLLWRQAGRCVLLEDCDQRSLPEAQLFHAINFVRETEGWLMMTARKSPAAWRLSTPDLLSRLRLATLTQIEPPGPDLIKAVLVKLFADRQIQIDQDVVNYASRHCDQSLEAIIRFVAAVDDAALASGRRITRPLAAATLKQTQVDYGPT